MINHVVRIAVVAGCIFGAVLSSASVARAEVQQDGVLEKVVFLARHGVRSPTKPIADLREMTGFNWPDWPVQPGEMTPHGEQALAAMVKAVHARYVEQGILPAGACGEVAQNVVVWADAADHRTQRTGQIWAEHIAPSCGVVAHWASSAQNPIFNGLSVHDISSAEHMAILHDFITLSSRPIPASVLSGLASLQSWVAPGGCTVGHKSKACLQAPVSLEWKDGKPRLKGGIATAGTLAENLLLMQTEGFSEKDFGSEGRDVEHGLQRVLPVHEYESSLLRRAPAYARVRNGQMADAIQAFLSDHVVSNIPDVTSQTRILVLAGHDSNQDAMMALFGVSWSFRDQPDSTAPDTVMAFERWRRPNGREEVVIRVYHQSVAQLRNAQEPDLKNGGIVLHQKHS
ncbi:histidine-type phosphatase [Neokomagataea anthophila]|uniref:Phosphoanhydride phosphohydrolase n=1 Tax=Neokomagataea anthophila TaxID=2826925 RepID=A0ABS5E8E8_9PROT|nr:histidine-type phosphatase [Neokomagataea anthophila]MBR0560187.1 phosphoanhydride phosphohydrolase [Neokomagataea anthophila]